ncbi:MAG: sugar phosphate nucleotidyltransferase [Candidatus Zipacnadales bacterium]
MPKLTAVLLVGGMGTRLRPLTYEVPKPLVLVANRPLITYSLRMLRRGGVERAILATGYRAKDLAAQLHDWQLDGLTVECIEERKTLGTAGGIRHALPYTKRSFIAMNGDQLIDLDVSALLQAHRETRAAVTIVVTRVADPSVYGTVRFTQNGRIEAFEEKRPPDKSTRSTTEGWINSGMYVWSPRVLDAIPAGKVYSNETQLFPALIASGERVFAYPLAQGAYWIDVGTPAKYLEANRAVLSGVLPWTEPPSHPLSISDIAPTAQVDPDTQIGPYVSIAERVKIGPGCTIRNSIVLTGAQIGENCTLENAIVMPYSQIAPETVLLCKHGANIVRGTTETNL